MGSEKIRITITPDADIRLEVDGVEGESCVELTRGFEERMGLEETDDNRELKPEYHEGEAEMELA